MTLLSACLGVSGVVSDPGFYKKKKEEKIETSVVTETTLFISRAQKMAAKSSPAARAVTPGSPQLLRALHSFCFLWSRSRNSGL